MRRLVQQVCDDLDSCYLGTMPERSSKRKRPTDINQLAASIVEEATSEEPKPEADPVHEAVVALGRLGGKKGGRARAEKLTPEQRRDIATRAAAVRWRKA